VSDTYATLETATRTRLDEVTASFWTSAELIRWLYDGAKEVARKTECLRATATIAAVSGTQQYTMATDIIRVHRVEYFNTGDTTIYTLEYRDVDSMDSIWWTQQTVTQDTPTFYTLWGYPPNLKLIAYPTPSHAGTFTVYYYKLPTDPVGVGSVACDLPTGWTDVAIDYATYMALMKDNDPRWQNYKALYMEHLEDLNEIALRYSDQAGMFLNDSGMMVPRWIWDEGYI
jgi:hypothetical protein